MISAKKPEYAPPCTRDTDSLAAGERLRAMRPRAGYTIEQAAQVVGVGRRCVMNYELDKTGGMKKDTVKELRGLYDMRKLIITN